MNNIRISINLSKIRGSRVLSCKTESGKSQKYVAIPVEELYIPSQKPEPFLMATMIHCPDSLYNDFMLKPYMAAADYKMLTQEQQRQIPIIGSGTFMQQQQSKEFAAKAEAVEVVAETLDPTDSTQPTNAPAATQNQNSSSGEARKMMAPAKDEFCVSENGGWTGPFDTFDAAVAYCELDQVNRQMIECWQGEIRRGRWTYDAATFSWRQTVSA